MRIFLKIFERGRPERVGLKSGKFSVSEVAYKVGSSSPMTFSREFKKHFGFPPSTLLKDKPAEKEPDQNL
ncbi:MAG: AraC family transcriptional regulator [Bacteroidales bacterium]|nr:AraC family transcriptional regulator [Bacteroidales bacterium]